MFLNSGTLEWALIAGIPTIYLIIPYRQALFRARSSEDGQDLRGSGLGGLGLGV